ncbi:hypothetical protein [Arthrobacter sp. AET 35A]|nr:hypothetical protein [Arthrobacter sp. AET 35A]
MRTSTVFHPASCSAVADKWDAQPKGLLVVAVKTADARQYVLSDSPIGD